MNIEKNHAAVALGRLGGQKKSAAKTAGCKANASKRFIYLLSDGSEYTSTGRGAQIYAHSEGIEIVGRKDIPEIELIHEDEDEDNNDYVRR